MSAPGWEGILDADEQILWQGKPRGGIDWAKVFDLQTFFGLFFTGFAVFWVSMATQIGEGMRNAPTFFQFFPLFGLLFVGIGLNMVIGRHLWDAYKRSGTHYTLTNKAAYIASQPLGRRSLQRIGIEEMTSPTLIDTSPGAVHFAERLVTYTRHRSRNRNGIAFSTGGKSTTVRQPYGFERIDDARQVYRLHRDAHAAD